VLHNLATLNEMLLYYRLMTKWSGLGDSTELSRMGLSQQLPETHQVQECLGERVVWEEGRETK
jgi:hypothetical protein